MRKIVLTAAVLFVSTADATAGPILDRLRARVHRPACTSGQCQPATAFPAPAVPSAAPVVTLPAGSACPGGVCPAQTAPARGLIFRR